uniref:Secreted protein n=1 Tax=Zooxanthella nutricula TaxID=1333877 RepID=A0A7S2QD20_9DINO|mmetsp:Transcript_86108/g.263544  ORF Transcript_86108/g.263544 Transcript_86108/m.263544 type:complete len:235 (+) Transcript_86108:3-707(+)
MSGVALAVLAGVSAVLVRASVIVVSDDRQAGCRSMYKCCVFQSPQTTAGHRQEACVLMEDIPAGAFGLGKACAEFDPDPKPPMIGEWRAWRKVDGHMAGHNGQPDQRNRCRGASEWMRARQGGTWVQRTHACGAQCKCCVSNELGSYGLRVEACVSVVHSRDSCANFKPPLPFPSSTKWSSFEKVDRGLDCNREDVTRKWWVRKSLSARGDVKGPWEQIDLSTLEESNPDLTSI